MEYIDRLATFKDPRDSEFADKLWKLAFDIVPGNNLLALEFLMIYNDDLAPLVQFFRVAEFIDEVFTYVCPEDADLVESLSVTDNNVERSGHLHIRLFFAQKDFIQNTIFINELCSKSEELIEATFKGDRNYEFYRDTRTISPIPTGGIVDDILDSKCGGTIRYWDFPRGTC